MASRSFSHLSFASFPYHFNTAAYLRFCLVVSFSCCRNNQLFFLFCVMCQSSLRCYGGVLFAANKLEVCSAILCALLFRTLLSSYLRFYFLIIFCIFSTAQNHDIVFSDITYSERRHNEEELFKKLYTIATFLFIDIKNIGCAL